MLHVDIAAHALRWTCFTRAHTHTRTLTALAMINQKVVGGGVAGVGRADVVEDQAEGEPMQQQISVFLEGVEIPANVASRFCAAGGDSKTKIRRRRKNSHDKKIFFLFLFHT